MKVTKAELMQIIREEVEAYKKVKLLENRKNQILRQLNEMDETVTETKICSECGRPMEEDNMEEGILGKMLGVMSPEEKSKVLDQLTASRYKGIIAQAAEAAGKDFNALAKELKDFVIKSKLPIEKDKYNNFSVFASGNPANFYYDPAKGWQTGSKTATTMGHMMREGKKSK